MKKINQRHGDWHAEKNEYRVPAIKAIIGDEYLLENGNTIKSEVYDSF